MDELPCRRTLLGVQGEMICPKKATLWSWVVVPVK